MLVFPFTTGETPELVQVGGKAMSLILMTKQGFPVPPGFVLSVTFFEPWLEHVQNTPEWAQVLNSSPENLKQNCDAVKSLCMGLELDDMDDLKRGLADPSIDLRALAEENTRFLRKLRQVRELPRIVDSRGKILRPPKKAAGEGELVGEPISPGLVRGKIKVLHEPDLSDNPLAFQKQ